MIANAKEAYIIKNGCPQMSDITGTGCMLSAITGAYVATNPQDLLSDVACATVMMGYSGELALQRVEKEKRGIGSLRVYLMDNLYMMDSTCLQEGMKIEKR